MVLRSRTTDPAAEGLRKGYRRCLDATLVTDFKACFRLRHGLAFCRYACGNFRPRLKQIEPDHRKDHFQVGKKGLHFGLVGLGQAAAIGGWLLPVVKRNAARPFRYFDQAGFQIAHMPLGQGLVAGGHDNGCLPEFPIGGASVDALADAFGLADIGAHAERVLRVGAVEDVDAGTIYLRPGQKLAEGPPATVRADESVRSAYLGRAH